MTKFAFRSEDGETLSDAVGIVFVELSKLGAVVNSNRPKAGEFSFTFVQDALHGAFQPFA
jgi:hypothetical protein